MLSILFDVVYIRIHKATNLLAFQANYMQEAISSAYEGKELCCQDNEATSCA